MLFAIANLLFYLAILTFNLHPKTSHSKMVYAELGGDYEISSNNRIAVIQNLGSMSLSYADLEPWQEKRLFSNSLELGSPFGSGLYSSFGLEFGRGVGFGLEAGWKKTTEEILNNTKEYSVIKNHYIESNILFAMLDIRMTLDLAKSPVAPYIGASLGFANVKNQGSEYKLYYALTESELEHIGATPTDGGIILKTNGIFRELKSINPAYQLKAGINFYMSDIISFNLGYKYFSLSRQEGNLDSKIINTTDDIGSIDNLAGIEDLNLNYAKFDNNAFAAKTAAVKQHSLDFALKFDLY